MKKILIITGLSVLSVFLGTYFSVKHFSVEEGPNFSNLIELQLPDTLKQLRSGEEWLGKVVVINHWATWCGPCREEIPMLVKFNQDMQGKGVQVVGIAHDLLDSARSFGDEIGLDYPSLVAITNGNEIMRAQGNNNTGALPFTVIFDPDGNIVQTKLGILSYQELSKMVSPYL